MSETVEIQFFGMQRIARRGTKSVGNEGATEQTV